MKRFFFIGLALLSGCSVLSKPYDLSDPSQTMIDITVQMPNGSMYTYQLFNFSPLSDLLAMIDCPSCDMTSLNPNTLLKDGDTIVLSELAGLRVSINQATIEELMVLPGIGLALAQRIIDYRTHYGFFQRIEDIMRVKGIKLKIFEQIKMSIQL